MKSTRRSFLFFYAGLAAITGSLNGVNAQEPQDSAYYYYYKIVNPEADDELARAIDFYQRRKQENLDRTDTLQAFNDLLLITIGYNKRGMEHEAEGAMVESINLLEPYSGVASKSYELQSLYNELGKSFRRKKDTAGARIQFEKALTLSTSRDDSIVMLNNISNVYKDAENYTKALDIINRAHALVLDGSTERNRALVLNNLGYVRSRLGMEGALEALTTSLEIRKRTNNLEGMYASYRSITEHALSQNNLEAAETYGDSAWAMAARLNIPEFEEDAMSLVIDVRGDSLARRYKEINSMLRDRAQFASVRDAYAKYNVEREQRRTAESLLEVERQKRFKVLLLAAIGLLIVCAAFLYYLIRQRFRREKLKQVLETENRISKKVHDEVANDLYHLMTKVQHQPDNEEYLLDDLEKVYHKSRDISKEVGDLNVEENFEETLRELMVSYQDNDVSVISKNLTGVSWNRYSDIQKTALYRVLQELLTNMKKHSRATVVVCAFGESRGRLEVAYSDNGIGCDLLDKSGLQNTENRMASINGAISFETAPRKGFKASIIL